jgi:hypothetical protein
MSVMAAVEVCRSVDMVVVDFPRNIGDTMTAFFWPEFAVAYGAALIGLACVVPYTPKLTSDASKKAQEPMYQPTLGS